jgi:hypothetical protein
LITSSSYCMGYQKHLSYNIAGGSPCQLVFGRDMIHNIAFKANWNRIQKRKQDLINKSNNKENKCRIPTYTSIKVGDQVLFKRHLKFSGSCQHLVRDLTQSNESIQKWNDSNPKGNCIRKGKHTPNLSISGNLWLSIITLEANDLPTLTRIKKQISLNTIGCKQ